MKQALFFLAGNAQFHSKDYSYKEYLDMRNSLKNLAQKHPHLATLTTAEEKYGIKHRQNCGEERCQVDILTLSGSEKPYE